MRNWYVTTEGAFYTPEAKALNSDITGTGMAAPGQGISDPTHYAFPVGTGTAEASEEIARSVLNLKGVDTASAEILEIYRSSDRQDYELGIGETAEDPAANGTFTVSAWDWVYTDTKTPKARETLVKQRRYHGIEELVFDKAGRERKQAPKPRRQRVARRTKR